MADHKDHRLADGSNIGRKTGEPPQLLVVKDERSARQDVFYPINFGKPPAGNKNIRPGAARIVSVFGDLCPVFNTR